MNDLQIRSALERYVGYGRKYPAAQSAAAEKYFADFSGKEGKELSNTTASAVAENAVNTGNTADAVNAAWKYSVPKNANTAGEDGGETESQADGIVDARELIRKKAEELLVKIQNGDTETYYPIGASFFTEKEWDKFLEKFDELEEEIRDLMREEHAKRAEQQEKREMEESQLLVSESTKCTYPASNPKEKDTLYMVSYTEEGIFCKKEGEEDCEWKLVYDSPEQYEKVMDLVHQFSPEENLRFTAHENFWADFLEDKIDMEDFLAFFKGTNNDMPDYSIIKGDSMYVDEAKAKYAPYMNPLGAHFYTAEEMLERQMALLEENAEELRISYREIYQKIHPEYNGERIFCEYPGGPLYTADEIERLMYRRMLEAEGFSSY